VGLGEIQRKCDKISGEDEISAWHVRRVFSSAGLVHQQAVREFRLAKKVSVDDQSLHARSKAPQGAALRML